MEMQPVNLLKELDLKDPEKREQVNKLRQAYKTDIKAHDYHATRLDNLDGGCVSFYDHYQNLKMQLICHDWFPDIQNKNFNQARMIKVMLNLEVEVLLKKIDELNEKVEKLEKSAAKTTEKTTAKKGKDIE